MKFTDYEVNRMKKFNLSGLALFSAHNTQLRVVGMKDEWSKDQKIF